MKVRIAQSDLCRNPDSPRVHGSHLPVNMSSPKSVRTLIYPENPPEVSPPLEVEASDTPHTNPGSAFTVGRQWGGDQLLTIAEVASLLRVPVSWVYGRTRKRSSERLPGYRLGKYWRFRENEVLAWVESQQGSSMQLAVRGTLGNDIGKGRRAK